MDALLAWPCSPVVQVGLYGQEGAAVIVAFPVPAISVRGAAEPAAAVFHLGLSALVVVDWDGVFGGLG